MDDAIPAGSAAVFAIFQYHDADSVAKALSDAIRTSTAQIEKGTAKEPKGGADENTGWARRLSLRRPAERGSGVFGTLPPVKRCPDSATLSRSVGCILLDEANVFLQRPEECARDSGWQDAIVGAELAASGNGGTAANLVGGACTRRS